MIERKQRVRGNRWEGKKWRSESEISTAESDKVTLDFPGEGWMRVSRGMLQFVMRARGCVIGGFCGRMADASSTGILVIILLFFRVCLYLCICFCD